MLVVAVATVYNRLGAIRPQQFPKREGIKYVVSCQGDRELNDNDYVEIIRKIFGEDCLYTLLDGFGLSINRNSAITLALNSDECEYIYIADDDITLNVDGLLMFAKTLKDSSFDFGAGIVSTSNGYFKFYSSSEFEINRFNSAKVSSVEIVISKTTLKDYNLKFDEDFGLGAKYPSGEEFIFCNDALRQGAKGCFYPIVLCQHPPESSGQDFFSSDDKIMAKGAMLGRSFGKVLGSLMILAFSLKKYNSYKQEIGIYRFTRNLFKGLCR
jgi:hypothetical protein